MKFEHLKSGIKHWLHDEIVSLAVSEAPALVVDYIDCDSPLLKLAETEVAFLVSDLLSNMTHAECKVIGGRVCEFKSGLVVAMDDSTEPPKLAGFILYKLPLFVTDEASISYAAVSSAYRGQGVFKQMLNVLQSDYPLIGLDCGLELVPMYEMLGFQVRASQGTHVGMTNGEMKGQNWGAGPEKLHNCPQYQQARKEIKSTLGIKANGRAYAKRDSGTRKKVKEVQAFLATRGLA